MQDFPFWTRIISAPELLVAQHVERTAPNCQLGAKYRSFGPIHRCSEPSCHDGPMDGKVTPLNPENDDDSEELDGDEKWLGTEGVGLS